MLSPFPGTARVDSNAARVRRQRAGTLDYVVVLRANVSVGPSVMGADSRISDRAPNRAKNCTAPRPLRAGNRPA
jgi:hypothetical protein